MPNAAIYARVSTKGQEASLETQLDRCRQVAAVRGFTVVLEVQEVVSGGAKRLPAREDLMKGARAGLFNAVLVVRLDRWGRSTVDLITTIQELERLGVVFIAIEDGIDLSTPAGRLQAEILASIANFERAMIQERAREGREAAKAKGVRFGRPPRLSKEQKLEVDRLLDLGVSKSEIARGLKVPRTTIRRHGRNSPPKSPDDGPLFRPGEDTEKARPA